MSFTRLGRFWRKIKLLYIFLLPARFAFLTLAIIGWAFLLSDQGADILRALVEYDDDVPVARHWRALALFVIAANLFSLQVWYWTRQILRVKPPDRIKEDEFFPYPPPPETFPKTVKWLPRALGALGYGFAIGGFIKIALSYSAEIDTAADWMLIWLALSLVVFVAFVSWRGRRIARQAGVSRIETLQWRYWRDFDTSTKRVLIATAILALAFFVWATLAPMQTTWLGSGTVLLITTGLWVTTGTVLVLIGIRFRFPILAALFVWALIVSPWADRNHVVRTSGPVDNPLVAGRPDVIGQLESWYSRMAPGEGGPVPIFVVATEGGGIRAAYWTASVLTLLQDKHPQFADHLFAISGVSGGSVGAAVFEALLVQRREEARPLDASHPAGVRRPPMEGKLREAAQRVLSADALTPTLAAMTQPDLVQRFLPFGWPDRESALETGWERGWLDGMEGDRTFTNGMLAAVGGDPALPALFLNGTMVETGDRVITSTVRIRPPVGDRLCPGPPPRGRTEILGEFRNAFDAFTYLRQDVPFSSAAGLSARFPYISPGGRLPGLPKEGKPTPPVGHVVDGGYFEVSATVTAAEIVTVINRVQAWHQKCGDWKRRITPYVILIDSANASTRSDNAPAKCKCDLSQPSFPPRRDLKGPTSPGSNDRVAEITSPVRALLASRGARGLQAIGDIGELFTSQAEPGPRVIEFRLIERDIPLPLGWLLSKRSRNLIDKATDYECGNFCARIKIADLLDVPPSLQADTVTANAQASEAALAAAAAQ